MDKLLKVAPNAATDEEKEAGGILKLRYLQFRDDSTSTKTLGFRVDAVQLDDEYERSRAAARARARARARALGLLHCSPTHPLGVGATPPRCLGPTNCASSQRASRCAP